MGLHSPIANRPARRSTRGASDVGRRMSGRLTDASPSPSLFSLIGLRPRDAKQRRAPPPLRPLPKTAAALFTIPTGCLSRVSPTLSRVLVPVAAVYSSCTFRVIRSGFQCGNCVSVQDGSRGEAQQL